MRRLYAITGLGAAALVAGVLLANLPRFLDRRQAEPPAPVTVSPTPQPSPAKPQPAASPKSHAPAVDVVRLSPAGDAVIAGRASPGARVIVRNGDDLIGDVTADDRGEWVFVPEVALPRGAHQLFFEELTPGGDPVRGTESVLVVVGDEESTRMGDGATAGQPPAIAAALTAAGLDPPRLVQSRDAGDPLLTIDAVHHDDAGRLTVLGGAPPRSRVRVHLGDALLGSALSAADGRWRLSAEPRLGADEQLLRAEHVDAAGRVVASSEVAFRRREVAGPGPAPGTLVVRRGDHLWAIARTVYGRGSAYTLIFDANRRQIRNPDLIYPGQVFSVPAGR